MTKFGQAHLNAGSLPANNYVSAYAVAAQLVLLSVILCCWASAQNVHNADYVRSSQPPIFTYQELVTLGDQEPIDPVLAKNSTLY